MPQVPYRPYPTVQPAGIPTPTLHVDTPVAAFGGAVGAALEHLGGQVEQSGNEIFGRAIALQELHNETEAREGDTQYMIQAGKIHADYSALQGKAAVDAYPDYIKNLSDTRTKIRSGLSNPMAQKMYDSSSMSFMGRSIFNGAGHAATQNKDWAVGTAKAQIDLDAKSVQDNPTDEGLFQEKLNRVKANATQLASLQGFDPAGPEAKDLSMKAESKLVAQRVTGMTRTHPFEAAKYLDEHKSQLTEDDFLKTDNVVRGTARAVGSVNIANEVYAGGKGTDTQPGKSLGDMENEAREKAKAFDPADPLLATHAVQALHGIYNQDKYAQRQFDLENQQTVDGAIVKGVKDEQELRADPKTAAAISALPKDKQLSIPGKINSYNAARDKVTDQETYNRLYGLSNNDVEGFLNTDLTKEKLSQGDMKTLMARQQKFKDVQSEDPRVNKAVATLRGAMGSQLQALGIFRRTEANKDDYDHFTGTLQIGIDDWTQTHGKPPTSKDITDTIGPEVIQQRTEKGWIWDSKRPFFQQDVPEKWSSDLKADVIAKGGVEPSDEQVYKAFVRTQFMKLYGKKSGE